MKPNVLTTGKIPNSEFILHIYAFRKVHPNEIRMAMAQWLKEHKRRTFPKSGTGTVISILGFDDLT